MQNFKHWIFDLDGTLTKPVHNFDKIRRTLDVPKGKLILEYIETLGQENSTKLKRHLAALEEELAAQARVGDRTGDACVYRRWWLWWPVHCTAAGAAAPVARGGGACEDHTRELGRALRLPAAPVRAGDGRAPRLGGGAPVLGSPGGHGH